MRKQKRKVRSDQIHRDYCTDGKMEKKITGIVMIGGGFHYYYYFNKEQQRNGKGGREIIPHSQLLF